MRCVNHSLTNWFVHSLSFVALGTMPLDTFTVLKPAVQYSGVSLLSNSSVELALAPELLLLLFPKLLVDLCSLAGLVAVCASGQSGVLLSALLVDGHILILILALLLTLELVLDGALVLCDGFRVRLES
jgi:hypothetical protein